MSEKEEKFRKEGLFGRGWLPPDERGKLIEEPEAEEEAEGLLMAGFQRFRVEPVALNRESKVGRWSLRPRAVADLPPSAKAWIRPS